MRAKSAPAHHPARQWSSRSRDTHSPLGQHKQVGRNTEQQPPFSQRQQAFGPCSHCSDQQVDHPRMDRSLAGSPAGPMAGWNHRSSSPGDHRTSRGKGGHGPHSQGGQQEPRQRTSQQSDRQLEQSRTRSDMAAERPYRSVRILAILDICHTIK